MAESVVSLKQSINALLRTQHLGVLATCGDEYPYSSLVGYAASDDLKYIIFATIRDTHKYKFIQKDARVSMLIDTHTNQVSDFKDAQAVTALGIAFEPQAAQYTQFRSIFLTKHPHLTEFVTDPNCALIGIEVRRYLLVSNFQNVQECELP